MAIRKKKVSELPKATTTAGLIVLGVDGNNDSVHADMELLRGNTAAQEWLNQNPGKTMADWYAYLRQPATEAAEESRKQNEEIRQEELKRVEAEESRAKAEEAREKAETSRRDAETSRAEAELKRDTAEKERISAETSREEAEAARKKSENGRVEAESGRVKAETDRVTAENKREEDTTARLKSADDATSRLHFLCDHRDKVIDGYWHRWNEETEEYENTGEIAKGNVMFATFGFRDGRLIMLTDPEYDGFIFLINKRGRLKVRI